MQHVNGRFLPNSFSPERFQPAALWSLASRSNLSAPAVLHNKKDLDCQEEGMHENSIWVVTAETKDLSVKCGHFSIRKVSWCPSRAGHCIIVLLINNINSSAMITHKSTIINTVSSQCRHALTSSRLTCQDLYLIFPCPCHWISHFSSAYLRNIQPVNIMLWAPFQ